MIKYPVTITTVATVVTWITTGALQDGKNDQKNDSKNEHQNDPKHDQKKHSQSDQKMTPSKMAKFRKLAIRYVKGQVREAEIGQMRVSINRSN